MNHVLQLVLIFQSAIASVPGTSNKLGEQVRAFSLWASSAMEAVKVTNLTQRYLRG